MRDPTTLPRINLGELYLHTQHPYRCPQCRRHRVFIIPEVHPIPHCDQCNVDFVEDVYIGRTQKEIDADSCFLHKWTPAQAIDVIASVPDDSFHWTAIAWNRVEYYADILASGKWVPYGQHWHPIRFSTEGDILTGIQRLLAVFITDLPMDAWVVDHSRQWFKQGQWVHPA